MENDRVIKTVMVVGAGASKDFSLRKRPDETTEMFKQRNCYSNQINMPTGEELVLKMISFEDEFKSEDKSIDESYSHNDKTYRNKICAIFPELRNYQEVTDFYTKATLYKGDLNKVEDSILLEFIEKFKKIRNLIIEEKEIFFHPQQNNKNYFNALENILDNLDDVQKVKELISHDRSLNLYNAFTLLFKQRDTKGKLKEKKHKDLRNKREKYFENHVKLAKLLKFYDPISIDNFLNSIRLSLISINVGGCEFQNEKRARKDLVQAGKELIAFYLLKAENKDIFNSDSKIWYRWFREAIIGGQINQDEDKDQSPEQIILNKINRLQIINFNYDRSFSFYLSSKMNQNINIDTKDDNICSAIIDNIHYPYGCLGKKDDQGNGVDFQEIPYGNLSNELKNQNLVGLFKDKISPYSKRIKTIGEKENENNLIKDLIDKSDTSINQNFYFLGFGFIEENINHITNLRPGEKIVQAYYRKIFYTNYGDLKKINLLAEKHASTGKLSNDAGMTSSTKGVYDALNEDFPLII